MYNFSGPKEKWLKSCDFSIMAAIITVLLNIIFYFYEISSREDPLNLNWK
jgi:hypothetical protein